MRVARFAPSALLISIAIAFFASVSRAQVPAVNGSTSTPIPGAGHDYLKMLNETTNPADGSASVRIGVPVPAGRLITPPFFFAYDSNGTAFPSQTPAGSAAWYSDNTTGVSQGGWAYSVPYLSFDSYYQTNFVNSYGVSFYCWFNKDFLFRDVTGGRHSLGMGWNELSSSYCGSINLQYSSTYTGGDPFFQAALQTGTTTIPNTSGVKGQDGSGTGVVGAAVASADGTVFHFTYPSSGQCNGNTYFSAPAPGRCILFPDGIVDRNGNQVLLTLSDGTDLSGGFSVTDDLGRTAVSASGFGSSGNTVTVSGLSNPYTITWGSAGYNFTVTQNVPSGNCGIPTTASGTNQVITAITLPNGRQYQFSYDPTYGELSKITYPFGGYISYTWGLNPQSASVNFGGTCSHVAIYDKPAILHRYVSFDGSTIALQQDFSYSTTWSPSYFGTWTSKQTTVTTHDLVRGTSFQTVYTYLPQYLPGQPYDVNKIDPAIPVEQTVVYQGTTGATLKTETKNWFNPQEMACELQTLDDGSITGAFLTYGPGGTVTDRKEYAFGQISSASACQNNTSAPSGITPARETATAYQSFAATPNFPSGPSIFDKPSSVVTYGNGTRVAETDYAYDQTSTLCAGSPTCITPTRHDEGGYGPSSTAPRGNATTVTKQCFQGTQTCTNSVTSYTYDETGQALSMTDPCGIATCSDMTGTGHTTTYSYADSYTSGTPPGPTNTYLTKITHPASNGVAHVENFSYAYADGQLTQSTDQNGLITSYKYNDSLDRLTETDLPDTGKTTISYNDTPFAPTVTTTKKINSTQSFASISVMDGLGHTTQTQLTSDPQGTVYADTTFDGLGRVWKQSNPYRSGSDITTTAGTSVFVYDSLGRKTSETYPDNSVLTTAYCGPSTLVTDPTGRWRRSRVDAFGRLVEVDEPNAVGATVNSNGCPGTGEPIWVTSYAVDALGNLTQVVQNGSHQRTFSYDSLSHLLSSSNPEVGTTSYAYDANSNVASKTSPAPNQDGSPGTGSATVSGSEQSIAGAPATSGTGSVTFSGTLQSKQVGTTAGTGSATVSGSEQSVVTGQTYATGTISISGYTSTFQSVTVGGHTCNFNFPRGTPTSNAATSVANCLSGTGIVGAHAIGSTVNLNSLVVGTAGNYSLSWSGFSGSISGMSGGSNGTTNYDTGSVWITVNGVQTSVSYGQSSTTSSLASALVTAINGNGSVPVTASLSGSTVNLTAKILGASTNYSLSAGSSTSQPSLFSHPSFTMSVSGSTLTGGSNTTIYDSGTSTITVNGHSDTVSWSGSGTTSSSIASALGSAINADSGSYVSASVSGSIVTLTAKATGAGTNYSLSSANTYDSTDFSSPSFSSSNSGSTLTGGHDAGATTWDSGSVWITLNGTQYSASYGQSSTSSSLASALASTISAGSFANASASGSVISITAKTVGSATNYSLASGSSTSQPSSFSSASFSVSVSGSSLTGGTDPGATTVTTSYTYDVLNRETVSSYSNGDPSVSTNYDESNCLGLSACENVGQRTSMTDAAGSEAWAYQVDSANARNVHVDKRTTSSITKTSTYYLDLVGNVTQAVYPTGRVMNYTYDNANRPSTAVDGSNGITYAAGFKTSPGGSCLANATCYTPQGTFYALSIGQTTSFTGLNLTHIYNNRLQPQEFKASSSGGNAIDLSYSYTDPSAGGDAGHVFSISNNLDGTRSEAFSYDQLNRLTSAWTTSTYSTNSAHCWGESFTLDTWGNLNSIAAIANSAYNGCSLESGFSAIADASNHTPMLSYDAAGNATADGFATYTWNAESQLKSAGGVNYTYDGEGRRVAKVGSKLYWYGSGGGDILAETDASGNTTAEYIFFGGKRVAMMPSSGNAIYYVEDLLGTSRVLTTNTGVVCYDSDFYPYGGERSYTNTCPQNYKFEGKERDTETGNDDFGARYYSNRFGRWLSADWSSVPVPVPYANLTNPQTLNLYAMVADDPESFADLDGHYGFNMGLTNVLGTDPDNSGSNCGIDAYCLGQEAAQSGGTPGPAAQPQGQQSSVVQDIKDTVAGAISAWAKDNGSSAPVQGNDLGQAIGHIGALVQGMYEMVQGGTAALAGGAEALVTAPAAGTGVGAVIPGAGVVTAVAGVAVATHGAAVFGNTLSNIHMSSEHKKGARESTRETHEEGQARRNRDRGGEKGDARRSPPRKRPDGWKGPWPPKPGTKWW